MVVATAGAAALAAGAAIAANTAVSPAASALAIQRRVQFMASPFDVLPVFGDPGNIQPEPFFEPQQRPRGHQRRTPAGRFPRADSARVIVAPFGRAVSRRSSSYACPWDA